MPTSHKIPPPTPPEKHPLWNPNGCQFLRQPTADPFRPGNCCPAKEPKNLGASIPPPTPPKTLRWLCWLPTPAWEREAERLRRRVRKGGGKKESAQVCIFNLIASSLHFAPRLKSPLTPLFAFGLFFFFYIFFKYDMDFPSMRALQTALQTPQAMQQTAMCPDSWLWIGVEINLILPALFFSTHFSFWL